MNKFQLFIVISNLLCISASYMPWIRQPVIDSEATTQFQMPEEQWFVQELDHFNGQDDRTWNQRYYVNETFWNPSLGGPIFFQVGGEAAIGPVYVTGLEMAVYAQTHGALMFALEHRFYGESQPLPDLSTDNLVYLSSEQALADAANFITAMKQKYGAQNSKVITFGGSYPGNLAAWFRVKYPHLTVASIASSAPVQATLDFYQYLDVVDESLTDVTGKQCDAQIAEATTIIEGMLSNNQQSQVQTLFQTCTPLNTANDISNFMSNLMGNFMTTVQYDNEGSPITIQTLCNIMNNGTDVLSNYVAINTLFLQLQGMSCLPVDYKQMIQELQNVTAATSGVGPRSWTYQTCAEFGYFQSTDSPNQPFGTLVPLSFYTQMCIDIGWNFTTRINETNNNYGGKNPSGTTNILFVNGSLDPWHSLSVTETNNDGIDAILIDGTAHCANMSPATSQDPPGLAIAQTQINAQIGLYLVD